jgi:hypothetical protein
MNLLPPAGFELIRLPTGAAWTIPEARKNLSSLWQKQKSTPPLRDLARRHPGHRTFPGRAPVTFLPVRGSPGWVVRPCVHGGLWGQLARDLYLGPERARKEIRCSFQLQTKKIPTPSILAVLFYPTGLFLRIDIITSYVPESRDLASFLSTRPKSAERARAFASVRHLLQICAQHGFRHPDLNARNILLSGSLAKKPKAWLLDVDAVTRNEVDSDHVTTSNQNRLLRSLLKRARYGDLGYSEREIPALWRELFPRR